MFEITDYESFTVYVKQFNNTLWRTKDKVRHYFYIIISYTLRY
jgi:hypothetical protein